MCSRARPRTAAETTVTLAVLTSAGSAAAPRGARRGSSRARRPGGCPRRTAGAGSG
jgi:hypothetical protein